jgi:hypothetical protein
MNSGDNWKRIRLGSHPDSLKVAKWRFVHSRFGKGVLMVDESGCHWICWGSVVVQQFEELEHWLAVENKQFEPMTIYFFEVDSVAGRRYLMVSSKPRNGET